MDLEEFNECKEKFVKYPPANPANIRAQDLLAAKNSLAWTQDKFPPWTLDQSVIIARTIQALCMEAGFFIGVCGGTLNKGTSCNDIDLLAVARTVDSKVGDLKLVLTAVGFVADVYDPNYEGELEGMTARFLLSYKHNNSVKVQFLVCGAIK